MLRACVVVILPLLLSGCAGGKAASAIEGTTWQLVEIRYGGKTFPAAADASLRLDADSGKATGNTGCNRVASHYELRDATVRFSGVAASRRLCVDAAVMEQERRFLAMLGSASGWSMEHGRFVLNAGGENVLVFVAVSESNE